MKKSNFLSLTKLWILYSAFCSVAGWTLSALHELNRPGWLFALAIFLAALVFVPGLNPLAGAALPSRKKFHALWQRRFRRGLPFCFFIASLLVLGRAVFNPGIFLGRDATSYRIPRVLHWIHDQGWTWISTIDVRFNNRGCAFEWMETPFLLLFRSDWLIPLLTAIPFFLLPGLIFVTFRHLQVGRHVAWSLAWILPSAYCHLLQAGTAATDGLAAFYALAAVALSLEGSRRANVSLLYYGVLSAALLTDLKASNIPLLLPIAVALYPGLSLFWQHRVRTFFVLLAASVVSFLPIAFANIIHLHDWSGMSGEPVIYKSANPLVAIFFNSILVLVYFLKPCFSPNAAPFCIFDTLHSSVITNFVSTHFEKYYGRINPHLDLEVFGLGLGNALLLLPFVVLFFFPSTVKTRRSLTLPQERGLGKVDLLSVGAWLALWATMAKSTLFALPRILAPYYPLLFFPFLRGSHADRIVRSRLWRYFAILQFSLLLGVVFLAPSPPPWPLDIATFLKSHLNSRLSGGLDTFVYVSRMRDHRDMLTSELPPEPVVAIAREWDRPESFYWKPYGSRLIIHVLANDTGETLLSRGVHHVIVGDDDFDQQDVSLPPLLERLHAVIEKRYIFVNPFNRGAPFTYSYLLRIVPLENSPPDQNTKGLPGSHAN